jgi:hypothetical protein
MKAGVFFTKILRAAFYANFLASAKNEPKLQVKKKATHKTFVQKAVRKLLVKLTPGVIFTNIPTYSFYG